MEDETCVELTAKEDGEFNNAFFGVFDGHGGPHASRFAKEHLLNQITKHESFHSRRDDGVQKAIMDGFLSTHLMMKQTVREWPPTASGYESTAGTTASVCFIMCDYKMHIGHLGDSRIVLGRQETDGLKAHCLTEDHKPDSPAEKKRIEESGGHIGTRDGVSCVIWSRRKVCKGTVPQLEHIPYLAIARSLGDFWSYNSKTEKYIVSPIPDVSSLPLDIKSHRCVVLATDGVWDVLKPKEVIDMVSNEEPNAATFLVQNALCKWKERGQRADNTSAIVIRLKE